MTGIFALAQLTFRQAIRNKALYGVAIVAVFLILFTMVLGELSLYESTRVMTDIGMFFITIIGVFLAIFSGIDALCADIEKRTIFTVVSKPIARHTIIIGKFLGVAFTLLVELGLLYLLFTGILIYNDIEIRPILLQAFFLLYLEVVLIASLSMMFGTFSGTILSAVMTFAFFVMGNLYDPIEKYALTHESSTIRALLKTGQYFLPNLRQFNLSTQLAHGIDMTWSYVFFAALHGMIMTVVCLMLASIIFKKQDFI